MLKFERKQYLILVRSDLSSWIEVRPLQKANSEAITKFLQEDVICRHGVVLKMVVDGGPENKGYVEILAKKYGVHRVVASAYYP